MLFQVRLDTTDSVLFEGTEAQCREVWKAFDNYNGAKNIDIYPKADSPSLNEELRDKIIKCMIEWTFEAQDSQSVKEILEYGCQGFDEMSDAELVDQFEQVMDEDYEEYELLLEAKAQLVIQEVLV